jgi:FixJ family two-component response regulator
MTSKQTVFTIDDEGIRDGLEMLLESMGQESRSFASGHDFLVA